MSEKIVVCDLRNSLSSNSAYKVYFPAEIDLNVHQKCREMLTEWARIMALDLESVGRKVVGFTRENDVTGWDVEASPDLLLWMGNFADDNDDPEWQVALSSSPNGIESSKRLSLRSGRTCQEALFKVLAKRYYLIPATNDVSEHIGVISMSLTMRRRRQSVLDKIDPVMYTVLNIAMGRYCEIAARYFPQTYYRDSLEFRNPLTLSNKDEICFSLG